MFGRGSYGINCLGATHRPGWPCIVRQHLWSNNQHRFSGNITFARVYRRLLSLPNIVSGVQSLTPHICFVLAFLVCSMRFSILAAVVTRLTTFLISGAETAVCSSRNTVAMDVATQDSLHKFTEAINCTGPGSFNITWHSSLVIGRTIEVSNQKNVSISGSGFHTIRGPQEDGNDTGTGIFAVSNGSSLLLNHLVLEGGSSEDGGAVVVLSSSYLHVTDCIFTNNTASRGGEQVCPGKRTHRNKSGQRVFL